MKWSIVKLDKKTAIHTFELSNTKKLVVYRLAKREWTYGIRVSGVNLPMTTEKYATLDNTKYASQTLLKELLFTIVTKM